MAQGHCRSLQASPSLENPRTFGLFSQAASDKARESGLKLHQRKFRLNIREKFFTGRVVRHWSMFHREVVESPSLGTFKRHVDVVLSDMVYW